jgi:hypothetical protein
MISIASMASVLKLSRLGKLNECNGCSSVIGHWLRSSCVFPLLDPADASTQTLQSPQQPSSSHFSWMAENGYASSQKCMDLNPTPITILIMV